MMLPRHCRAILGLLPMISLVVPCDAWTTTKPTAQSLSCSSERRSWLLGSTGSATSIDENIIPTTDGDERTLRVQELLRLSRELGPVGSRRSAEDQQRMLNAALELKPFSDPNPAELPLSGIHNLVYSAAAGGSSGKLGPIDGTVTQEFVNATTFINSVTVGPLEIGLTASRQVKSDTILAVKFHKTTVSVFGVPLVDKEISGGGSWKMLFAGHITDTDGTRKLVRVMQTPSLFVLEQPSLVPT